ncbi:hypothetical protein RJZ56_002946 [Blastomyces dermatitidis]|uniref:Adenylate cyclase n=1 Tax=Ajellomyces dermatitidis (strain ER-3 / ATCC MYA-2586) TaxID=559297 RepID=A0ABM9YGF8_AJEDR|nr:adenylate cyclase [Blastomyces dermatitidis ER-3]EEQ86301.2 adenylate cyclase [Blastomyces dermatitidis ER-3]EQL28475.1 adenylate cyclase [Blastomyces dermatitidis ATCC 26199]
MTEPNPPPQAASSTPTPSPPANDEIDDSNAAMKDSKGWDGKLRVERHAVLTNPEALEDPDYSDENAPPLEEIEADEDLLSDLGNDVEDIDLVHCRISSLPALHLERFTHLEKLCLRQNQIARMSFPENLGPTLTDLDLYDNLITRIRGLDGFTKLTSLDLSFNNIKHIKNVSHLVHLTDLYFVQNRIQKIEGLDGLKVLRNLELAANRIREIENLDDLTALEELWLGKNKITEIKNIDALTNLKIISLPSNRLTTISGLSNLQNLEELYVSHNAITAISGLENNTNLRVLDISSNQISKLENISHLTHLEELWASNNQLASFDEVERELKDKEELKTVYFEGNPLQTNSPVLYRNKVRLTLPQVQQIDATYVRVS